MSKRSSPWILVVDDSWVVRDSMVKLLRDRGFTACAAKDGAEALALLTTSEHPALIFLDIVMPNVDGFGVMDALSRTPALSTIPVVVITASDLDAGFDALALTKPLDPEDIVNIAAAFCPRSGPPAAPPLAA